MNNIVALQNLEKQPRRARSPKNPFSVQHKPMELQMCGIFPVLPMETMTNLKIQSRAITAPVKAPLVGWWLEYYVFYVTHRQLENQTMLDMMLDPTVSLPNSNGDTGQTHWSGRGFDWYKAIKDTVVKYWFRDQGERAEVHELRTGRPLVKLKQDSWWDSVTLDSKLPNDTEGSGYEEEERLRLVWETLRGQSFTKMSYEDFLQSYGVRSKTVNQKRPELLRKVSDWQYPSNTVNPADGTVSTAVSWSIAESADKNRFFEEPGFIAVFSVARPKIYPVNQSGIYPYLNNAFSWLPALMNDTPETSLRKFSATTGPMGAFNVEYWVDMRDAFLYGDQFIDVMETVTTPNTASCVEFPVTNANNTKWVTEAMMNELFVGTTNFNQSVHQDGILSLHVLGNQQDAT